MERIKNIIFDFGGVILDIDFNAMEEAFKKIGVSNPKELYSKATQSQLFYKLEQGKISNDEFRDQLRKLLECTISDEKIDEAWNALLVGYSRYRMILLSQIKKNYRIFLLSNSNKIHYDLYLKWLEDEFGYKSFNELFEKAYFSFECGMSKPDIQFYKKVLDENKLLPHETLYIDDLLENVEPAEKLGIYGYHLEEGEEILELFDEHYQLYED